MIVMVVAASPAAEVVVAVVVAAPSPAVAHVASSASVYKPGNAVPCYVLKRINFSDLGHRSGRGCYFESIIKFRNLDHFSEVC